MSFRSDKFSFLKIYLLERKCMCMSGGRRRGRERAQADSPLSVEPNNVGLNLRTQRWPELKPRARRFNWLSHLGAPGQTNFLYHFRVIMLYPDQHGPYRDWWPGGRREISGKGLGNSMGWILRGTCSVQQAIQIYKVFVKCLQFGESPYTELRHKISGSIRVSTTVGSLLI